MTVGGVLVDDAHSCLTIARETVTVRLDAKSDAYRRLVALFSPALSEQNKGKFAEIKDGHPWTMMPVPYWAWMDVQAEVAEILAGSRDENGLKFSWDLIKGELSICHCFVSGTRIEITPHIVPIESVPSFAQAKHRFFLSATLIDDSIVLREFGVTRKAATDPIRPPIVGDIGERMILAPSLIDRSLEADIPGLCKTISDRGTNVVVLVPSFKAAERWANAGAVSPKTEDVSKAVEKLRTTEGNFVVLANRYDGIDLPDRACRVLVIDGVPSGESYYDQHVASVRADSTLVTGRVAQTIEQGLGRGVRSGKDYCVVLLCGSQLVQFVGVKDRLNLFSPETKKQFLIGQEIVRRSKAEAAAPRTKLADLMRKCVNRDPAWKKYHAKQMLNLVQPAQDPLKLEIASVEREASLRFRAGEGTEASDLVRSKLDPDKFAADSDKGWFLQVAATYRHPDDPIRAQEMQKRAYTWNRLLFRPVAGVRYNRVIEKTGIQAQNVLAWVRKHTDPNAITVSMEAIINRLVFGIHHLRFEEAWAELGTVLGFQSERPEEELGLGPDNLWAMPEGQYLLTEVKNEVKPDRTRVYQSETEQMANSANWFAEEYGKGTPVTLLMVHRVELLADSAFPPEGTKVMTPPKLDKLHERLRGFAAALAGKAPDSWIAAEVGSLLASHGLDGGSLRTAYCVPAKRK